MQGGEKNTVSIYISFLNSCKKNCIFLLCLRAFSARFCDVSSAQNWQVIWNEQNERKWSARLKNWKWRPNTFKVTSLQTFTTGSCSDHYLDELLYREWSRLPDVSEEHFASIFTLTIFFFFISIFISSCLTIHCPQTN